MNICVVGAGNIGLASAFSLAMDEDNKVTLYTKKAFDPSTLVLWDEETSAEYENLNVHVEPNLDIALKDADYVLCTYPAFLREAFVKEASDSLSARTNLGFIPGYGGIEYACTNLIDKGVTIFGFQRVPFVARQEEKKVSKILSRKKELFISAIPNDRSKSIAKDIESLYKIKTSALSNFLTVTLAPSNPLLHLTGLYNVFKDYKDGDVIDRQLMFYEEWNDETSELLFRYDAELQEICKRLVPLDMSGVVSLPIYYESDTPHKMTKKLQSIEAFKVVTVPLIKMNDSYIPDYSSRMFVEDFPYGIAIIKYFGIITGVDTPAIDTILKFYEDKTGICYYNSDNSFGKDFDSACTPYKYGLKTLEEVVNFYL